MLAAGGICPWQSQSVGSRAWSRDSMEGKCKETLAANLDGKARETVGKLVGRVSGRSKT